MMKPTLVALLVLFSVALSGSVPNLHAVYVSGSAAVPNGTEGSLNLGDAKELRFNYDGGAFKLPYERITTLRAQLLGLRQDFIDRILGKRVHDTTCGGLVP